jgi:hypothetical protein
MRAQYTKRWTTVHLSHQQSLAEHSFNVAVLALELAESVFGEVTPKIKAEILEYSLLHDIDEVITGDIPTPTKNRLAEMCSTVNDVIAHEAKAIARDVDPDVVIIVKVADMIEGTFHVKQHCCGIHAEQVSNFCDINLGNSLADMRNEDLSRAALDLWGVLNDGLRSW